MPKSNAEKCRAYRQKKKQHKVKKVAKSSTERVREFRIRRKALLNEQHNIYTAENNTSTVQNSENDHCDSRVDVLNVQVDVSVRNNIENNYFFEMPKSNAEICREYRKRKKAKNKIKKVKPEIPLKKINNAKNCQMYRLRKKMLAQGNQSSTNQVLYTPSTPNSPMTVGSPLLLVAATGAVKIPRLKQTAIPSKNLPERKHDIEVSIVEDSCPDQHSEQTQENDLTDIVKTIPRLKQNAIPNTTFPEGKQGNERLNQNPEHSHENDLSNKAKIISRLKQNSLSSNKPPEKKHVVIIKQDSSPIPSGDTRLNDLSNVARKLALGVGLLSSFKWLNEPSEWCFENNVLTLKTENETDFWQGTWYNSFVNTGHVYGVELQDDFTLEVCVEAEFESLNDQAGLMLYVDEKHWLKAGIEYNKDQPMIGSILTNEVSDWATGVFQGDPSKFWLRLTKMGNVVCVKYSTDNICWNSLRLSTFPICDKYFVGPMSCTPQRGGLVVRFSHLTFSIVQSSRKTVFK